VEKRHPAHTLPWFLSCVLLSGYHYWVHAMTGPMGPRQDEGGAAFWPHISPAPSCFPCLPIPLTLDLPSPPHPPRALQMELLELRSERARAIEGRTLTGHAKNAMGYAMSAYCVYRCEDEAPRCALVV